jgi:ApaG protein
MISKISEGVQISVETFYQPDHSDAQANEYMFAYRITIENSNKYPVQLLSRHWHIFDSDGAYREVEGEGVIGVQPKIESGEKYQYISGCNLHTEMGRMHGTYKMQNTFTKKNFTVNIPAFEMVAPEKLN